MVVEARVDEAPPTVPVPPEPDTVAIDDERLLHVPPGAASLRETVAP